jgi:hypothetical protein
MCNQQRELGILHQNSSHSPTRFVAEIGDSPSITRRLLTTFKPILSFETTQLVNFIRVTRFTTVSSSGHTVSTMNDGQGKMQLSRQFPGGIVCNHEYPVDVPAKLQTGDLANTSQKCRHHSQLAPNGWLKVKLIYDRQSVGQSASLSWCRAPIWVQRPIFLSP